MTISVVQSKSGRADTAALSVASDPFDSATTAGNWLIVCVGGYQSNKTVTVSDSKSNTWSTYDVYRDNAVNANGAVQIFSTRIADGKAGSSHTVTCTAGSNVEWEMAVMEVSGLAASSVLDQTGTDLGPYDDLSSTVTTAGTTDTADELVVAVWQICSNVTSVGVSTAATTDYTGVYTNQNSSQTAGFQVSYKIVNSTGSQSATWGHDAYGTEASDVFHSAIATYRAGATTTKYLRLLAHPSAQSASGVAGAVFSVPSGAAGSKLTGATRYGEFTGKSFSGTLDPSGAAVLKVSCDAFGGGALTTSSTPVALVRTATKTTGLVSCTVIEE